MSDHTDRTQKDWGVATLERRYSDLREAGTSSSARRQTSVLQCLRLTGARGGRGNEGTMAVGKLDREASLECGENKTLSAQSQEKGDGQQVRVRSNEQAMAPRLSSK